MSLVLNLVVWNDDTSILEPTTKPASIHCDSLSSALEIPNISIDLAKAKSEAPVDFFKTVNKKQTEFLLNKVDLSLPSSEN